jgi:hypothetical protein
MYAKRINPVLFFIELFDAQWQNDGRATVGVRYRPDVRQRKKA